MVDSYSVIEWAGAARLSHELIAPPAQKGKAL
jgi:hypothetical protein